MCQTEPLYYQQTAARWQTTQRDKPPLIPGELLFIQMCREWQEKRGWILKKKKKQQRTKTFFFKICDYLYMLNCFLWLYCHSIACLQSPFEQQEVLHHTIPLIALKIVHFCSVFPDSFFYYQSLVKDDRKCLCAYSKPIASSVNSRSMNCQKNVKSYQNACFHI